LTFIAYRLPRIVHALLLRATINCFADILRVLTA